MCDEVGTPTGRATKTHQKAREIVDADYNRRILAPPDSPSKVVGGNGPSDSTTNVASAATNVGATTTAATPGQASAFVLGAKADWFWLGPGFALATMATMGILFAAHHAETATSLAFALTLMFVGPHYAATYRRAFSSVDILRAHPIVTIVVPIILLGVVLASLRWPRVVGAPFFATYVLWSGYHYSGQSLGLALLFPLRQGARLSPAEKRLVAIPLYSSWVLSIAGLFALDETARNPAYVLTRQLFGDVHLPRAALALGTILVAASLASVAILAKQRRRSGRPLPHAVWAVVIGQLIWFCAGAWNPFLNIVLVPLFHSAQYLALTGWHQTRGRSVTHFTGYFVTVLLLGLVVNPGLMWLGRSFAGEGPVVAAAVLSFINLHHFLMDGRIWRLRDRRVAASFGA